MGVVTRRALTSFAHERGDDGARRVREIAAAPVTAHPDEPLSAVAHRMAQTGRTRPPVVTRAASSQLLGMITLANLLRARRRHLEEERRRERVLRLEVLVPAALRRGGTPRSASGSAVSGKRPEAQRGSGLALRPGAGWALVSAAPRQSGALWYLAAACGRWRPSRAPRRGGLAG